MRLDVDRLKDATALAVVLVLIALAAIVAIMALLLAIENAPWVLVVPIGFVVIVVFIYWALGRKA